MELRDYQSRAIYDIDRAFAAGIESLILHAPTGAGKTVIAAAYIRRQIDAGHRVTFLAPRRELVEQASEKLEEVGLQFGRDQNIFMAGYELAEELGHLPVQVCTKDTLLSRHRSGRIQNLPRSDYVFVDEAHLSVTRTWLELIEEIKARGANFNRLLVNIWIFLTQRERAQVLRDAWEMTDHCSDEIWLDLWETIDPAETMTAEESALLVAMPERVILFRGYCAKRGNPNGLSWTPDPEVAKRFSHYGFGRRPDAQPTVRSIEIDRSQIWAFLLSRGGSEPECIVLYPPSERDSAK